MNGKSDPFWSKLRYIPGGWGAEPPIRVSVLSALTRAGTDLPACGSRAPGVGVGDCRNGNSFQGCEQIGPAHEVAGVDQFVLQAAPQALDERTQDRKIMLTTMSVTGRIRICK